MAELAGPAGGDDGHRNGIGDGAGELEVIAVGRPIAIHAREQDLPRPALGCLTGPGDCFAALDQVAPTIDVDVPGGVASL